MLKIKPNLSTTFHPQIDSQTECTNQILEQYLRVYCNHLQDDWHDLLPLAEFAYNNAPQASTGQSPFFITYSFHPCAKFSMIDSTTPDALEHVKALSSGHEAASEVI